MVDGILNILKPANMTSHQVVSYIRRTLNTKKVGHTGTLDPNAMGILPICIGKATRVSEYVMDLNKKYRAEITFGVSSDTGDLYGNLSTEPLERNITKEDMSTALTQFIGKIKQIPPMASAIKVEGKKLYEYYRKGLEVEVPSREVEIYSLQLVEKFQADNKFFFDVHCSKGTYIRTLCQDIGHALKTKALMSYLIRTEVGPFNLDNSIFLQELTLENVTKNLHPMDSVLYKLEKVQLEANDIKRLKNGLVINHNGSSQGNVRVYDEKDCFVAICTYDGKKLKPNKVFF